MKLGIAQAYNGEHRAYRQYALELGAEAYFFNIDSGGWLDNIKEADAFIWHADAKEENYRVIHDRVYFIENLLKKKVFPDMNMYFAYGDKIKETDIFKINNIPAPKTFITYKREQALTFIKTTKYPFVLKDAHGYGGHHVYLVKNRQEALGLVEKIFSAKGLRHHQAVMKNYFLAQEYISVDKDLRVIVIGDKIACAYWRRMDDNWKHNISQGGQASFDGVPMKALDLCLKFSRKMKFHWMSYDLFVLQDDQVLMNEYSCNFGITVPVRAGYNIRRWQVEYIIRHIKDGKRHRQNCRQGA